MQEVTINHIRSCRVPFYAKTATARFEPLNAKDTETFAFEGRVWVGGSERYSQLWKVRDDAGRDFYIPARGLVRSWPDHVYRQDPVAFEDTVALWYEEGE